ncbi:MAG TPA: hypothetical protein PKY05_14430 [Fibrobacteria bacterium]|nr:hypothetical protein [Fibrobacteria bacterium]
MMFGDASMHATWPGVLRDRIRLAHPNGVTSDDLWELLTERDAVVRTDDGHQRAFRNAMEYLTEVGLVRKDCGYWYEIPLTRKAL